MMIYVVCCDRNVRVLFSMLYLQDKEELLENNYRQMMKRDREDPEKGEDYVCKVQMSWFVLFFLSFWVLNNRKMPFKLFIVFLNQSISS